MIALTIGLAVFVGIALGLLGGGGSILTVPLLAYVAGMDAKQAIATSLLVVGVTSVVGAVSHARAGHVQWRTGLMFGAAGMVQAGSPAFLKTSLWTVDGMSSPTARMDTDLLGDAYVAEFSAFCAAVRSGAPTLVGGRDARAALRIALACIESVEAGGTVVVRDTDRAVVA